MKSPRKNYARCWLRSKLLNAFQRHSTQIHDRATLLLERADGQGVLAGGEFEHADFPRHEALEVAGLLDGELDLGGAGFEGDGRAAAALAATLDRKSTRLNSSHSGESRMPSSA